MVIVHYRCADLCREVICPARTYRRCSLASEDDPLGQNLVCRNIAVHLVIEAHDVELLGKTVDSHSIILIHSAGYRSCRVFSVADILQPLGHNQTFRLPL